MPIVLDSAGVSHIMSNSLSADQEGYMVTVDLENQIVTDGLGLSKNFDIDDFRKESLLKGLDDIGMSLEKITSIDKYESKIEKLKPWILRNG